MKEILIVAVLLVLWLSLMIADVRAYSDPKEGNAYSSNVPGRVTAPIQ